ncbi:MAG: prephenate dehydrogenase [Kiritimatiellae bacterium]|nr:prephenate dehydrogenase [Kiritimatiellia bacterium]
MALPRTVAVIGLGLMGGSLAMALRRRGAARRVVGSSRRAEVRAAAVAAGAVDAAFESPEAAAEGADVAVVCAPVCVIPELVARIAPVLKRGGLLTDVGSTKRWVLERSQAAARAAGVAMVGSHPIAGSEQQGFDAARPDLYEGAVTVVVTDGAERADLERTERLWRAVGARVVRMSAAEHDRWIARTSHLPHLAAALVARCAARDGGDPQRIRALIGPGFRDTTRVAGGSPDLWRDIVETNRDAIEGELDCLARGVAELRAAVGRGAFAEVRALLEEGRRARAELLRGAISGDEAVE